MRWPRDADVTFQKQEPVLIERHAPPERSPAAAAEPEPERDEVLALDPQQRAIVQAQWALVERAFRRDLPNHRPKDPEPMQPAAPEQRRDAHEVVQPAAANAPAHPAAGPLNAPDPIERSVDGTARTPRAQPKVRSRWFGGPSVAEQKRIVQPKRLAASASGAAQRQRALLMSVLTIACASAAFALWRLDRPVERRVAAEQPASTVPERVLPSATPAAKAPVAPSAALAQPARKAEAARPAPPPPPPAAASAAPAADPGPARAADDLPVADRRQQGPAREARATAPVRASGPQRAEVASARSTRPAWQRDERIRDSNVRAQVAPWREAVAPLPDPEPEPTAAGPMPAPLPYHPSPSPAWRSRAGAAADVPRGMAAPLPYGGPEVGATPGGR